MPCSDRKLSGAKLPKINMAELSWRRCFGRGILLPSKQMKVT